ncbi:efflux RND transporter permease subunit [Sulfuriroseicoccus oceanibius]|uniref:Efflux RND transporter permease subunit n=1 Tax=Sulfuriroseicoccus oceanibius TaxID=2707525 RepID=A0A6B3LD98_9BACT|nr:efflux RND transporter permease subunit [Sulfuriroseicoccus oceanibius]QQL45784.1 efflux RND transporter permease subunit [Sulfuriroseicoccus oceanibius]
MLNHLIRFSLGHRMIIVVIALLVLVTGTRTATNLPVEVLPDLTKPTVTLLTEAPGYAPEEVETLVTVPLENELMGVSGVTRVRSKSDAGLSLIYVEFDWDADIYQARQFVWERLQLATETLPEGVTPFMTPVASLMGEIMLIGISCPDGSVSPSDLRTEADWTVRQRLKGIPGVAEVLSMGGGVKQLQIQPDPNKMLAHDVTFDEVMTAAEAAAKNTTGGFLTTRAQEIMVRNLGMTTKPADIGRTVVKYVNDRPVTLSDVGEVAWDLEPMRGDAAINGVPGVIVSVTKSPGFDTLKMTDKVNAAIEELQDALPAGVVIEPLFQQSDFINHAIDNLLEALRDGALMVLLVLFLFLLNVRTTFITLMAIPLSFGVTVLVFRWFGITVNSMTLGGAAVAIGMVVDDAIVDVENVFRRLRENAMLAEPKPKLQVIASASGEVRSSIFYATTLIILVFVPLLGLSGVEGRLFTPIAIATMVSMAASFVVSLTVIPVLCSFLLNPKPGKEHRDGLVVRVLKAGFRKTWLKLALDHPVVAITIAGLLFAFAAAVYPTMGKDFLPSFKEETAVVATTAAPGTSLKQTTELSMIGAKMLMQIEGVRNVGYRVGRAERGDHVVPVSTVEFDIDFEQGEDARPRQEVLDEIRETMRGIPGTFSVLSGPLGDRIGHMLSGVPAKVAIKVFGPDLDEIHRIGEQIQKIAKEIPGLEEAKLEQQAPIPQLRIEPDRERAEAYGINVGDLNDQLSVLVGGENVAELYEGQRTIDLVVRLPEAWRESPEKLRTMQIRTASGASVPLYQLADIREATGPNVIMREDTQRRFVVSINPTARDLTGLIKKLEQRVAAEVEIPPGYFLSYEGEFIAQRDAANRILISAVVVLVVVALLLYSYFGTPIFAVQVLADIPLALIGGVLFTWREIDNISIATLVGFIAVTGIAARNSIMMISHYLHLMRHEGEGFTREMIERGTLERLVPVLMTAVSAGLALVPLVMAADQPGKEILHPVAVVIVGGLVTSTVLGLGVTPAVFRLIGRKAALRAVETNAPATQ